MRSRREKRTTKTTLTLRVAKLEEKRSDALLIIDQARLHEDEGDDKPSGQEDSDSAGQLSRGVRVRSRDTKRGVEEGRVRQPETTVRGEG